MKVPVVVLLISLNIFITSANGFDKCGTALFYDGLSINGLKTKRGEFPFLCAMYSLELREFFCGGTLITSKHVLSAAHCIKDKGMQHNVDPEDLTILLGRYNLDLTDERGSHREYVSDINIHPQWKRSTLSYDADIAIITMQRQISFSINIRPVCFPPLSDKKPIENLEGIIVGWGLTENVTTSEEHPNKSKMRTVSTVFCLLDQPDTGFIASNRTFCAIGENTGPCSGDSGGGFFVKHEDLWTIRGIISATTLKDAFVCDVDKYSVYTNLEEYHDWIVEKVNLVTCSGEKRYLCSIQHAKESLVKDKVKTLEEASTLTTVEWLKSLRRKLSSVVCEDDGFVTAGTVTKIDEYPWTVLLEHLKPDGSIVLHCGGSLINSRYVLTVAHCVSGQQLENIRLGEWNTDTVSDCSTSDPTLCSRHVKVKVSQVIVHPEFRSTNYHNDIALIRLAEPVHYSIFIKPICLPLDQKLWAEDLADKYYNIAGWGITESKGSSIKLKGNIPYFPQNQCKNNFKKQGKEIIESQICAGGEFGSSDSCNKDPGGPLMDYVLDGDVSYWCLAGIFSYEAHDCSRTDAPGVYTRVSSFLQWIELNIK